MKMDTAGTLFQTDQSAAAEQGGGGTSAASLAAQSETQTNESQTNEFQTNEFQTNESRQDDAQATVAPAQAEGERLSETWDELPYEFDNCVVDLRIVLLPSDGGEGGRDVIVSATTHTDDPLILALRESELGQLPAPLAALVGRLKDVLPERGRVAREKRLKAADEKRRAEERRKLTQSARPAASQSRVAQAQSQSTTAPLFGGGQPAGASQGTTAPAAPPRPNTQSGTVPTGGQQGSLFG